MLVGEHRRPLGFRQKIDDTDVLEKSYCFRQENPDDTRSGQYRQEAATEKQPLDQRFLKFNDVVFLQHNDTYKAGKIYLFPTEACLTRPRIHFAVTAHNRLPRTTSRRSQGNSERILRQKVWSSTNPCSHI